MYSNNLNANQRFVIEYNKNGYYSIKNLNSGLYLEADGLEIRQRKQDLQTIAQDWALEDAGNGYYYIVSRCGGLYLNFNGSLNLNLTSKNSNNTQKFKFEKKANNVGTKTLEDGYYIISSALNTSKVIDIEGASIKAEANALLWTKNSRNNQKFKITYDGKGYYTITSVKSKKVLDVAYAGLNNESNVQQYTSTNSNWQKWIIEKNQDGSYSIISAHNGLYIDLSYAKVTDGNNIQLYTGNGGKNQKFIFEKTEAVEGTKILSDGYYKIQTKKDSNSFFDIANFSNKAHTDIGLWTSNNGYNQRFKITYGENGYYTIKSVHSGKVFDIASNEANVEQDDEAGIEEQEWVIKSDGAGTYYIISAHNGLYVDVDSGKPKLNKESKLVGQKFVFTKTEVEVGSQTIADGTYQIITGIDNNKVLDITGASNSSGANVEIWTNNKQTNQKFNVKYQGNGYYKITALNSGKAIGISEVGTGSLVDVKQYDVSDTFLQNWIIKSSGNGYYNIISACNGLYLDICNSSSNNGTNVDAYAKNNNSNQKFKFVASAEIKLQSGTYGSSGLKVKGDSRGQNLKYYKIGNGPNVFFATFAIHGWEDCFSYDGKELTKIAEAFKDKLLAMQDESLASKWTIYIFPSLNPDGEYYGYTHNGPGRTTLYSAAPKNKGIDMNRCWSTGFKVYTGDRNYNGTESFQAYEARSLRDFLLSHKATNGQTVLVDLHGWLNETIGDNGIGAYYRSQFGMSKHVDTYGMGYIINWARSNLGSNGRTARSSLVELPEAWSSSQVSAWGYANKYINATLNMLRGI